MTVYRFIAARKTEHSVKTMCRRLGVSRSGYHAWQRRPPSPRSREDAALIERIAQIHERSLKTLDASERREVAGYLAKYTTKSTEQVGGLLHRVTEHELAALPVREHVRSYLREAFRLAADGAFAECRFAACAHALGYRGHRLTKSRRYSTTFKALREARERHVYAQLLARSGDATQRAIAGATERLSSLRYAGLGHLTAADAFLAASAAARAREQRKAARGEGVFSRGALKSTVHGGCWDEGWSPRADAVMVGP